MNFRYINKMNTKLLLGAAVCALSLNSCEDALDVTQPGELNPETIFQTSNDLQRFLLGDGYDGLSLNSEIQFTSVFTDEVAEGPSYNGSNAALRTYVLDVDTPEVGAIWRRNHSSINTANRLFAAAELIDVVPGSADETQVNHILAQAAILRAYAMINLSSYFSPDMSDDSALAGFLFTDVPPASVQPQRATNGDVFAQVIEDLQFAEANLDPTQNDYLFFTQTFVDGLRARMYAYRQNYPLARQFAQEVMSESGLVITPPAQYADMLSDAIQGEVIFAMARPETGGAAVSNIWHFNFTAITGGAFWSMGINQFNVLDDIPGDPRRTTVVDATSDVAANQVIINKYPGKGTAQLVNDLKVMRLSEMYFILAESYVTTNLGMAAQVMKDFRDARIGTPQPLPVYANEQQAWADILLERRRELCFEAHRYVDLRRLGTLASRSIDRNAVDDNTAAPQTLTITDHRFTLPVPLSELEANPGVQQNPNY